MAGFNRATAARALARRLAVQALYRWQINTGSWQELVQEFAGDPDMARAEQPYFAALVRGVLDETSALESALQPCLDRPAAHLDPVERAVLLVATHELTHQPAVPYRVVINEAVSLTRRFGATDGHKYVNGVLDRLARSLRPDER
jgi:transcription antitermination protein NusB